MLRCIGADSIHAPGLEHSPATPLLASPFPVPPDGPTNQHLPLPLARQSAVVWHLGGCRGRGEEQGLGTLGEGTDGVEAGSGAPLGTFQSWRLCLDDQMSLVGWGEGTCQVICST